jgi:hypothetical protein
MSNETGMISFKFSGRAHFCQSSIRFAAQPDKKGRAIRYKSSFYLLVILSDRRRTTSR